MIFLRSLLFNILFWIDTTVLSLCILLVRPFGLKYSYFFGRAWSRLNMLLLRLICGIRYRVEWRGKPPEGPAVYLAKHQSAWETVAFPAFMPPYMWVLKRELFYIPIFGWALVVLGHIGINRDLGIRSMKAINEEGQKVLQSGYSMVIFPEGTRVEPGKVGEFNPGGASLAVKAGVPIVPVTHNAGRLWGKRGFAKQPGLITVVMDEPIPTEGLPPSQRKELNQRVKDIIAQRLQEIGG